MVQEQGICGSQPYGAISVASVFFCIAGTKHAGYKMFHSLFHKNDTGWGKEIYRMSQTDAPPRGETEKMKNHSSWKLTHTSRKKPIQMQKSAQKKIWSHCEQKMKNEWEKI